MPGIYGSRKDYLQRRFAADAPAVSTDQRGARRASLDDRRIPASRRRASTAEAAPDQSPPGLAAAQIDQFPT